MDKKCWKTLAKWYERMYRYTAKQRDTAWEKLREERAERDKRIAELEAELAKRDNGIWIDGMRATGGGHDVEEYYINTEEKCEP
jgi:hypothetical protein